jgi:hypothetical protein
MLGTVQLNDQTDLMAGEIDEVSADGHLSSEMRPFDRNAR